MWFVEAGGRRRAGLIAAALIALVCVLALPAAASASAEFEVNGTADETDLPLAGCLTAGGECTLRAAIEEANASANTLEELDRISFDPAVFDGGAASTIALTSSLPTIDDPLIINGECERPNEVRAPCVGVDGPVAGPAFAVKTALAAEIEGLSITGAETAIEVEDAELFGVSANWIGIGLDGSADGNGVGIVYGSGADDGRVGGEPGRGNLFANNAHGVDLLGGARVRVLGNGFGLNPDGSLAALGEEVAVAAGAGAEARIALNSIVDAEVGILTFGTAGAEGSAIEENLIEGSETNGILIEDDNNRVLGNEVVASEASGIRIQGAGPTPATGNLVGGNGEAEENGIIASASDAIEIVDLEATGNEVARNWGFENAGLFIGLIAANPSTEPNGPNGGIKPPAFSTSFRSSASGVGAVEGALIRVFRKASTEAGELESFLAETQADAEGNWKVAYPGQIPTGTLVTATQTSKGATSELAAPAATTPDQIIVIDGGCAFMSTCGGGKGDAKPPVPPALPVPETRITKGPKAKAHSTTAKFKFTASVKGSSFQCKLDKQPFKACNSPKKYKQLKPGKHVFKVRAVNSAGSADPTPAKRKFTVLG